MQIRSITRANLLLHFIASNCVECWAQNARVAPLQRVASTPLQILSNSVLRLLNAPMLSRGLLSHTDLNWRKPSVSSASNSKIPQESDEPIQQNFALSADTLRMPPSHAIRRLGLREELRFIAMAKAGDRFAQQKLILHHLPLLKMIARRYWKDGLSHEELINEGFFGLVRAIERFDIGRNVRFGTYAKWWIRDAMEQSLLNQSRLIRLPRYVVQMQNKQRRDQPTTHEDLTTDNQPEKTDDNPDATLTQYQNLLEVAEVIDNDGDTPLLDGVEETTPEAVLRDKQDITRLHRALSTLSEREQKIIAYRFGLNELEPATLEAMASEFGLSCERIRQIQKSALSKLKALLIAQESAAAEISNRSKLSVGKKRNINEACA